MIDISHPHQLAPDAAHAVVQTIAEKLHERFEVDGRIILAPGQVRVTAQLGFPYSMMQSMVESEIERVLGERLG